MGLIYRTGRGACSKRLVCFKIGMFDFLVGSGVRFLGIHADGLRSTFVVTELKPNTTDAVLLCGGKGSRLGFLTRSTPKPLLPIGGRPFLLRLLLHLRRQGFRRFILVTHYLSEKFHDFLASCDEFRGETLVISEEEPLGTGGALRNAAAHVHSSSFLALNGDSYVSQPLAPVLHEHGRGDRFFTMVVVRAEKILGGRDSKDAVILDPNGKVSGFVPRGRVSEGWVNAGVYVLDKAVVLSWPSGRYDLESNLGSLLGSMGVQAFHSEARLLDIGTPECYANADQVLTAIQSDELEDSL